METLLFIKKNYENKIIHDLNVFRFSVRRGSPISIKPEEYEIYIEQEQNDFSPFLRFRYNYGDEALNKMMVEYEKFRKEIESQYYKSYLTSPQRFLYVCQYGNINFNNLMIQNAKYIKNCK